MDDVGSRIRQARKQKGLTQEDFAPLVNSSTMSIRRYESGERVANMAFLQRAADVLDVDVNWLRNGQTLAERDAAMRARAKEAFWSVDLNEKLKQIGYSTDFAEDDAYLWINYPDGTLEITEAELKELNESANSFLRFKLEELKEKHQDQFKPKK